MNPIYIEPNDQNSALQPQPGYRKRHQRPLSERGIWGKLLDAVLFPALIWIVLTLIMNYWILSGYVPSESMEPTMMAGEYILADRLAYQNGVRPARGDVIVFRHASASDELLVKRIIAIGNDKVELIGGSVYINGCLIDESEYARGKTSALIEGKDKFEVPEGCVLVFGDNRENSADARYWEDPYLKYEEIIGKVSTVYSPPFGKTQPRFFTPVESADIRFYDKAESAEIRKKQTETESSEKTAVQNKDDIKTDSSTKETEE